MKIALCFIISYEHIVNKEEIWKEWIEPNKDIINVYFYFKDFAKIKSKWIIEHTILPNYIYETSYYHVIPAYLSIMSFALTTDIHNSWFCLLTESCCPIISPKKFRFLFYKNYNKSIINCKQSWWNIEFHKRANLAKLPKEFHLANEPWFILTREHVVKVLNFIKLQPKITKTICSGGLANESLFAIILFGNKQVDSNSVILSVTHIADWSRMKNATSPFIFKTASEIDVNFIDSELEKNKFAIFIRKIAPEFPNNILRHYIYEKNKKNDEHLILIEPVVFICKKWSNFILQFVPVIIPILLCVIFYFN
jgi:hypothetical protein